MCGSDQCSLCNAVVFPVRAGMLAGGQFLVVPLIHHLVVSQLC